MTSPNILMNMHKTKTLENLHDFTLYPNAWYLAQGYGWVRRNLYSNIKLLRKKNRYCGKILYDFYRILADVNILVKSYKTAFYWNKLALGIGTHSRDLLDDLIYLSQVVGNEDLFNKYIARYVYLFGNESYNALYDTSLQKDAQTQQFLHTLNMFCPSKAVRQIPDNREKYLDFLRTLCYGATNNVTIFSDRIQKHIEDGGQIEIADMYYFPMDTLNSPYFWELVIKNKTQITIATYDFDVIVSNKTCKNDDNVLNRKEYADMVPYLHLARTQQDIRKVQNIKKMFPLWKDSQLCVSFFASYGRMPCWCEFYSYFLNFINPDNFLTQY